MRFRNTGGPHQETVQTLHRWILWQLHLLQVECCHYTACSHACDWPFYSSVVLCIAAIMWLRRRQRCCRRETARGSASSWEEPKVKKRKRKILASLTYVTSEQWTHLLTSLIIPAETPIEEFAPTPAFPALQYLESVDQGGVAWRAGLRTGDFLIEVGHLQHYYIHEYCLSIFIYTCVCVRLRWTVMMWWRWVTVRWWLWFVREEVGCWWKSCPSPGSPSLTSSGRKVPPSLSTAPVCSIHLSFPATTCFWSIIIIIIMT